MKALSQYVDEALVRDLRVALADGEFTGLSFEQAMQFLLSDGIIPASNLPVDSVLALEDWVRSRARSAA